MRTSTNTTLLLRVVAFVGAVILLATACGDDGSTDANPAPGDDTPVDSVDDTPVDSGDPADRSTELIGNWSITTFQLAGGLGETATTGSEPVEMNFSDDGTFTFSTGCNTGEGNWETVGVYQDENDNGFPVGQYIEFDGLSRTEIACDDALADQDLSIGGAIRAARLVTLEDGTLTLSRDGNLMIEATRG